MNKSLGLLAFLLLFMACNHEDFEFDPGQKVKVCHQKGNGDWEIREINPNALGGHLSHGDIVLIDADGDGWVVEENECLPGGDCDDNDPTIFPGAEELCGDGVDNDCDGAIDEDCIVPCWEDVLDQFDYSNWGLTIGLDEAPSLEFLFFYQNIASNRFCVDDSEIDFIGIESSKFTPTATCSYGIDGESFFFEVSEEEGELINEALLQLAADNNIPPSLDVICGGSITQEDITNFLLSNVPDHLKEKLNSKN